MAEPPIRRETDGESEDYRPRRGNGGGGVDLGWGSARLRLFGRDGIIVLILVVIIAGFLFILQQYAEIARIREVEHRAIVRALTRMECVMTFPFDDRARFRLGQKSFQDACPWLNEGTP